MKLQEIIVPFGLACLTLWALSYFWGPTDTQQNTGVQQGQEFSVARVAQMCHPVNTEVDFYDQHKKEGDVLTVQGYHSDLNFSSAGGVLVRQDFQRDLAGVPGAITTLSVAGATEQSKGAFLVALDEMTPYDFTLVTSTQVDNGTKLAYESTTAQAKIKKEFTISSKQYQIDLDITIEPLAAGTAIQPRLFVPGPWMSDLSDEKVAGVVFTPRDSLKKLAPDNVIDVAWASPKIFGVEDRYFVCAMFADRDNFTQRAFFKRVEGTRLTAIFEGPKITEKTTWHLSFYCGPKEAAQLAEVDKRLEAVMDYGWLAPVSKALLYLLTLIYAYIGNYGWAIIILTVLMRLLLWPITQKGKTNLRKSNEMSQKLKYLQQKYKDEPEVLREAQMELYRKYGMSPLSGCLPLLVQIPIFIGLNFALRNSIELYKAPFMLWITDLSARDPYYVLPGLVGIAFFLTMSATSKDPRHKLAMFIASMVIAGLTASLSAGLLLFMLVSGFLGFVETKFAQGTTAS